MSGTLIVKRDDITASCLVEAGTHVYSTKMKFQAQEKEERSRTLKTMRQSK